MGTTDNEKIWLKGGCHCAAIRFEVRVDTWDAVQCNCSICHMSGFEHLIVSQDRFRLLSGQAQLVTYRFNTGVARHTFCRRCGIKAFYTPRSHPDGVSVNLRCLDDVAVRARFRLKVFDGRHWEDHIDEIR